MGYECPAGNSKHWWDRKEIGLRRDIFQQASTGGKVWLRERAGTPNEERLGVHVTRRKYCKEGVGTERTGGTPEGMV